MNTVLSLIILFKQNSLKTDNNYIIADYILNHLHEIEDKGIKDFASECHVSTNSILRFCQLLGFDTYKAFKNAFISTLKVRQLQLVEKNKNIDFNFLFQQIPHMCHNEFDIHHFQDVLDKIVQQINQYKIIHVYGATYPLALLQSFVEDMALLGVMVYVHQINYKNDFIIDNKGIHVIISYTGRFMETNRNIYNKIIHTKQPTVLISQVKDNIGSVDYLLQLPECQSNYYDDYILMMINTYMTASYASMYS